MNDFLTSATGGVASGIVMMLLGGLIVMIKRPFKRLTESVEKLTKEVSTLSKQVATIEGTLPQLIERVGNLERRRR